MTAQETPTDLRVMSPAQLITWANGSVDAVRFRTYLDVIPDRIPAELAEAGLMEMKDGKPWVMKYGHKGPKPYDSSGMFGRDYGLESKSNAKSE